MSFHKVAPVRKSNRKAAPSPKKAVPARKKGAHASKRRPVGNKG
uniref:Uncharacterized protein n=1 Tax=Streptomyces sp. NBC_01401 TaxID=2903854 RepID=A0AAU3GVT7_9ACTN